MKKKVFTYQNQKNRWTKQDEERFVQMVKDGFTAKQIVESMDIDMDRMQSKLYRKFGTYSLDKAMEAVQSEQG